MPPLERHDFTVKRELLIVGWRSGWVLRRWRPRKGLDKSNVGDSKIQRNRATSINAGPRTRADKLRWKVIVKIRRFRTHTKRNLRVPRLLRMKLLAFGNSRCANLWRRATRRERNQSRRRGR
jgi:hypothetical protein